MLRKLSTWVAYGLIALLLAFSVLSVFGVVLIRTVLSESMLPTISKGDLVVGLSWVQPSSGDIAIYDQHDLSGELHQDVVHRVIDVAANGEFIFKGDNNRSQDAFPVKPSEIRATIVATIPGVGLLFAGLGFGQTVFIFIGIAAIGFGIFRLIR